MTGTILPPVQTMMIRNIANSALVLLALLVIDQQYANRATTEAELANLLQVDPRTIHKKCVDLSAIGFLTGCGADRWVLTPAGRRTLFAENPPHVLRSIEESEALLSDGLEVSAQNVLLEEEEAKFAKIVQTSSSSDLSSESAARTFCATTKQILQAAAELFNADVYLHDAILEREPEYVLGWVAKAWNDRERLSSPTSLIYRRLMDLVDLPVMYRRNPVRGLPAEFLRSIGMVSEAEKVEDKPVNVPATFEIPSYDVDVLEQDCSWRSIANDLPEIKGASFHGGEPVSVDGYVMTVSLRQIGRDDRAQFANEHVSAIASRIYAEQCGVSTARVVFVLEEV